ncbi:MAG: Ig-like domain-containing protein [Acidobacteriota bacterium]
MKYYRLLLISALLALTCNAFGQTATGFTAVVSTVGSSQITLQGSVAGGNVLTFGTSVSGCGGCTAPANGTLSNFSSSTGSLLYTPNSGFTGTDSFTFTAISTPSGGGASTSSSQATVSVTITNARTTITDYLLNPDGSARTGKVTFILTQGATSPAGIIPASATVTANLAVDGSFTTSVYPTTSLSPRAYYQVWWQSTTTGSRELIGIYDIPASTSILTLSPYKVTDTNLSARYTFLDLASFQAFQNKSFGVQVQSGGTAIATRTAINFIAGTNMSLSIADNSGSGRVDVTINGPAGGGTGGSVNSGTAGRLPIYASTGTTLSELAIGGANKVLGVTAAGTGHEYKTVTAGTGIGISHGTGAFTITNTGVVAINGNSFAGQFIVIGSSTCGLSPGVTSSLGTTTVCVPAASSSASGYITAGTQTLAGMKTFTGSNGTDIPLIVQDAASGSTILQQWKDSSGTVYGNFAVNGTANSGLSTNKLTVGGSASTIQAGYVVYVSNASSSEGESPSGMLLNTSLTANSTTSNLRGAFISYTLSGTGTHTPSAGRSAAVDANFTFAGSGTLTTIKSIRGQLTLNNTGTITNGYGLYSTGDFSGGGTVTNFFHHYAAAPTLGTVTFTNQYGFYAESLSGATNNWGVYTAGTMGSSLGGFFDLRGRTAPAVSNGGEGREYFDSSANTYKASANGGIYGIRPVFLSGSATLDFPSTAAGGSQDLTISVSGATVGKPVFLGLPGGHAAGTSYQAWISSSGTITVRHVNSTGSSVDPASGTFSVLIQQ